MIREWLGYETVELTSPLAEQECLERLRQSIGSEWKPFQSRAILGTTGEHSFRLSVQQGSFKRNLFQVFVYGTTAAQGSATKIVCRFGMLRLAAAIAGVLFLAGLVAVAMQTIDSLLAARSVADVLFAAALPAVFLIFVAFTVFVGRVIAQDEPFILLAFLRDTIEARETQPTV